MSGSKTARSRATVARRVTVKQHFSEQEKLEKMLFTVIGVKPDKTKLSSKKEALLNIYIACLPLLRMMAGIVYVPSPEFLFNLYTEKQLTDLLVAFSKAFNRVFSKTIILETPDNRLALRTMLIFACMSQVEFEAYIRHEGVKGKEMEGGGSGSNGFFDKVFSKQYKSSQRGGTSGPVSSKAVVTHGSSTAVSASNVAATTAARSAQLGALAEQAMGAVARVYESQARENIALFELIGGLDIPGRIRESLSNETKLEENIAEFLTLLRDEFSTNAGSVLELAPGTKGSNVVSIHTLKELITGLKVEKKALICGLTHRGGKNILETTGWGDWWAVNVGGAIASAGVAAGAVWAFQTGQQESYEPAPDAAWGIYTVETMDGKSLTQSIGSVWAPKFPERGRPPPFGFLADSVTLKPEADKALIDGFFTSHVESSVPASQEALEKAAKPFIRQLEEENKKLQKEKGEVEKKLADLLRIETGVEGIIRLTTIKPRELSTEEQAEKTKAKKRLEEIIEKITENEDKIDGYNKLVVPEMVEYPWKETEDGKRIPGRISYPRHMMKQVSSCPMGTNYTDIAGNWGCSAVTHPTSSYLTYNPQHRTWELSRYIAIKGRNEPMDCLAPDSYISATSMTSVVGAAGLAHAMTKNPIITGAAGLAAFLGMSPAVTPCASAGLAWTLTTTGTMLTGAGIIGGLGGAGYLLYRGYSKYEERARKDKIIKEASEAIQQLTDQVLLQKVKELFITKIIRDIKTMQQADFVRTIQVVTDELGPTNRNLLRPYLPRDGAPMKDVPDDVRDSLVKKLIPKVIAIYLEAESAKIQAAFEREHRGSIGAYKAFFTTREGGATKALIISSVLKEASTNKDFMAKISALLGLYPDYKVKFKNSANGVFKHMDLLSEVIVNLRTSEMARSFAENETSVAHSLGSVTGLLTYAQGLGAAIPQGVPRNPVLDGIPPAAAIANQNNALKYALSAPKGGSKGGGRRTRRNRRRNHRRNTRRH